MDIASLSLEGNMQILYYGDSSVSMCSPFHRGTEPLSLYNLLLIGKYADLVL